MVTVQSMEMLDIVLFNWFYISLMPFARKDGGAVVQVIVNDSTQFLFFLKLLGCNIGLYLGNCR